MLIGLSSAREVRSWKLSSDTLDRTWQGLMTSLGLFLNRSHLMIRCTTETWWVPCECASSTCAINRWHQRSQSQKKVSQHLRGCIRVKWHHIGTLISSGKVNQTQRLLRQEVRACFRASTIVFALQILLLKDGTVPPRILFFCKSWIFLEIERNRNHVRSIDEPEKQFGLGQDVFNESLSHGHSQFEQR
jgi:hypothetical protein